MKRALVLASIALRNLSISDNFSSGWAFASASVMVSVAFPLRALYKAHTFILILTIENLFFLILGMNVGTARVGGGVVFVNCP